MKLFSVALFSLAACGTAFGLTGQATDLALPAALSVTIFYSTFASAYALPEHLRSLEDHIIDKRHQRGQKGQGNGNGNAAGRNSTANAGQNADTSGNKNNNSNNAKGSGRNGNNTNGNGNSNANSSNTAAQPQQSSKSTSSGSSSGPGTLPAGFPPAPPAPGFVAGEGNGQAASTKANSRKNGNQG